jgi:hypothetical protein
MSTTVQQPPSSTTAKHAAPTTAAAAPQPKATSTATTTNGYRLPCDNTLQHAAKLSIVEDKPIMMDYWTNSLDKTVLIGVKDTQEKLLVKSEEEYTSPISKIFKVGTEFIIMTENSIYIVDVNIPTKRISA